MKKLILLSCVLFTAAACSSNSPRSKPGAMDSEGATSEHLRPSAQSREQAQARAKQVAKTSYQLWFKLENDNGNNPDYQGHVTLQFDLRPKAREIGSQLPIDFEEGAIQSIEINGKKLENVADPKRYDKHRIWIELSDLNLGAKNKIEIAFTHPYSHNGNGLHRFKDPVDSKTYLYTHFEPYSAHRMFPCFDQPDLKATYELTAEVPEGWQVISNTIEKSSTGGVWKFPVSKVFSTYLFALHAGPYVSWKGDADGIPLRLFARKSLAQYVDHAEWLDITSRGLAFFAKEFGYAYPFVKYDQVIVPDFNAGAMENVAAITFTEYFVYRTRVTQDQKRRRANTILHEMAHQWFGDLVTMRWWNGLWLNETFATFMGTKAVDEATTFKGSWLAFFRQKTGAYWEDQLVTTHPIEVPVPDTDVADSIFDGITYGKGASVIKQLNFRIGEDQFQDGVQRYFMKYAFKNATTWDFVKMLGEASDEDLGKWQHSWLQTAGVNTVRAEWKCKPNDDEKSKIKEVISDFRLVQTAPEDHPELREHKTRIGLFYKKPPKHKLIEKGWLSTDAKYSGPISEKGELLNKPCPDFVYPNLGDEDYVKVELDPISLGLAAHELSNFGDPLMRAMLWHTLWEMVVDGKFRAQEFADTVIEHLGKETDTQVVEGVLGNLVRAEDTRPSVIHYLGGENRAHYARKIEDYIAAKLAKSPAGSDLQLVWYLAYLRAAQSPKGIERLEHILAAKEKVPGIKIDQDRRWELLAALAQRGAPGIKDRIAEESKKDVTDIGQKAAIAADARIPDAANKRAWMDKLARKDPATALPISKLREAMRNINLVGQEELTRAELDAYFEKVATFAKAGTDSDEEYVSTYTRLLYPAICDPAVVERTSETLRKYPELPAYVVKALKMGRQEEQRCIRARAFSEKKD